MSKSGESHEVVFKSVDQAERLVWAEVYIPNVPDSDREFMTPEEIKKMSYGFMRDMNLTSVDHQHDNVLVDGCCVIESFIARKGDPEFVEGAWVVGMHIDNDDAWERVEKGEINGFSMQAMVIKEPKDVILQMDDILEGFTMKSEKDQHFHEFLVSYDSDGNFRGGKTTKAEDGHFHLIRQGTVTMEAAGHSHRFAHVENLHILG